VIAERVADLGWSNLVDEPGLAGRLIETEAGGPPFLAELTAAHRRLLDERWPAHQWLAFADGEPVAAVRSIAIRWDGTSGGAPGAGIGQLLGDAEPDADPLPDTLAVVDLTVAPQRRGTGVGPRILTELDELRRRAGLARVLLLVRPHPKRLHPLVPFARYLAAVGPEGRPWDGWLAAVWAAGFHPVRGVDRSLVARAPLAAWERWYGRPFPTSGPYLVPGAIKPAIVELERDEGRYREPHLWVAPQAQLRQRTVDAAQLRVPEDAWRRALASAGVVAGSRRHREVRRGPLTDATTLPAPPTGDDRSLR
jgi:GNAT superfamily N-acetyltransferase